VRYFAAQGYGAVVAVGPLARGAAQVTAPEYPRTRFASHSALRSRRRSAPPALPRAWRR
jgi:hypothetical protein